MLSKSGSAIWIYLHLLIDDSFSPKCSTETSKKKTLSSEDLTSTVLSPSNVCNVRKVVQAGFDSHIMQQLLFKVLNKDFNTTTTDASMNILV